MIIKDDEFVNSMNDLELRVWTSFGDELKNFLDDRRAEIYKELVEKLLKSLQDIIANMSIKVHILHSHQDNYFRIVNTVSMSKTVPFQTIRFIISTQFKYQMSSI